MDEKDKAKELVLKFIIIPDGALPPDSNRAWIDKTLAKQCAIIAVDEILNGIKEYHYSSQILKNSTYTYWQKVKEYIK